MLYTDEDLENMTLSEAQAEISRYPRAYARGTC